MKLDERPTLGILSNLRQFSLLVLVNGFVGAMVGLERTVLPLLAPELGVATASVTLSFLVAFGAVKAVANLVAGRLSDSGTRKRLLVWGWAFALPVSPMIIWAPSWGWIVAANVLLGLSQGLAWSATVIMKIDLAGPRRRGLAMGLNEAAGYGAVAVTALVTGALAAAFGPRPVPFLLGVAIAAAGFLLSVTLVRDTSAHARAEAHPGPRDEGGGLREVFVRASFRHRTLSAVNLAGLANNLNDGMAWGLLPIFLAGQGLGVGRIGVVAAVYPAVWGLGQLATGAASDRLGRKALVVGGLGVQAASIAAFVAADGYLGWLAAAAGMGAGTALVYPTLLAAVGDTAHPSWRASAVGVYRLWRDLGYVVGALVSGAVADAFGLEAAILTVAGITAVAALVVAARMQETLPSLGTTRESRLREESVPRRRMS